MLCETYVAHPETFDDLCYLRRAVGNRHPDMLVLSSLDELQQALYTSSHRIMAHGLDETEGHDLSHVAPERFEEDGDLILDQPEDFPIRLANFQQGLTGNATPPERKSWTERNNGESIAVVNSNPDLVVSNPCIFLAVPVETSAELIAAFPNGYFTGDLSPFELHRLATSLQEIGYHLIALGVSYVAFWAQRPLDDPTIAQRSAIIASLYEKADIDALNAALGRKRHLVLRYTD